MESWGKCQGQSKCFLIVRESKADGYLVLSSLMPPLSLVLLLDALSFWVEMDLVFAIRFSLLLLLLRCRGLLLCDWEFNYSLRVVIDRSLYRSLRWISGFLLDTIASCICCQNILTKRLERLPLVVAVLFVIHTFGSLSVLFNQNVFVLLCLNLAIG